jgi:hypothetical protein
MPNFNLSWKGYEYASTEHCSVAILEHEILINGQIRSRPKDLDLRIAYGIVLNQSWETKNIRINGQFEKQLIDFDFRRSADGWTSWDGQQLEGGTEPDISFSPLTNTIPIRRLNLKAGESAEIDVLYFDLANNSVDVRKQRYTRLSADRYKFETVPKDFEAVIEVDDNSFVEDYPDLFIRR